MAMRGPVSTACAAMTITSAAPCSPDGTCAYRRRPSRSTAAPSSQTQLLESAIINVRAVSAGALPGP